MLVDLLRDVVHSFTDLLDDEILLVEIQLFELNTLPHHVVEVVFDLLVVKLELLVALLRLDQKRDEETARFLHYSENYFRGPELVLRPLYQSLEGLDDLLDTVLEG